VLCMSQGLPLGYELYCKQAKLTDEINLEGLESDICFLAIAKGLDWPLLVVVQRYAPASNAGFYPGVLIVPETDILFLGAGERVLIYDLKLPRKLGVDMADTGFHDWHRHGSFVVMSAELELAAWDINAQKNGLHL